MVKEKFYLRLRELRKQYGVSQNELAEYLQLSRQSISQWENGKAYPDIDSVILLSKFFGMTVDELLDVDGKYSLAEENNTQELSEEIEAANDEINDQCTEEEEKAETHSEPEWAMDMKSSFDILVAAILLALSSMIPVIGIVVPVAVMIWAKKRKTEKRVVYVICVLGMLLGIYNTYAMLNYLFIPNVGNVIIEKV